MSGYEISATLRASEDRGSRKMALCGTASSPAVRCCRLRHLVGRRARAAPRGGHRHASLPGRHVHRPHGNDPACRAHARRANRPWRAGHPVRAVSPGRRPRDRAPDHPRVPENGARPDRHQRALLPAVSVGGPDGVARGDCRVGRAGVLGVRGTRAAVRHRPGRPRSQHRPAEPRGHRPRRPEHRRRPPRARAPGTVDHRLWLGADRD